MLHLITTIDKRRLTIGPKGVINATEDSVETIPQSEIDLCRKWLSRATVVNPPGMSSFWVKHVVENWAGCPISNGALIVAAYEAGFQIGKEATDRSANVNLGLNSIEIQEFDCGCGHP